MGCSPTFSNRDPRSLAVANGDDRPTTDSAQVDRRRREAERLEEAVVAEAWGGKASKTPRRNAPLAAALGYAYSRLRGCAGCAGALSPPTLESTPPPARRQ